MQIIVKDGKLSCDLCKSALIFLGLAQIANAEAAYISQCKICNKIIKLNIKRAAV